MNWKLLGRALLVTIGLFAVIAILVLLILKAPILLLPITAFILVFSVVYNLMEKDSYYKDDSNDRMSWNNDYDEEDEQ